MPRHEEDARTRAMTRSPLRPASRRARSSGAVSPERTGVRSVPVARARCADRAIPGGRRQSTHILSVRFATDAPPRGRRPPGEIGIDGDVEHAVRCRRPRDVAAELRVHAFGRHCHLADACLVRHYIGARAQVATRRRRLESFKPPGILHVVYGERPRPRLPSAPFILAARDAHEVHPPRLAVEAITERRPRNREFSRPPAVGRAAYQSASSSRPSIRSGRDVRMACRIGRGGSTTAPCRCLGANDAAAGRGESRKSAPTHVRTD